MGAVIEVFARWSTREEEQSIAGALKRFCLSPHTPDWLIGLEGDYPNAKPTWDKAQQSLAQLISMEGPFALSVGSVSMLDGPRDAAKPNYLPVLSIGFVDGLSTSWDDPALVQAARDLATMLEALGANWTMPITLD